MALNENQALQVVEKCRLFPGYHARAVRHPDGGWVVELNIPARMVTLVSVEQAQVALVAITKL